MGVNCCDVCALCGLCHDPRLEDNREFWDVIEEWGIQPLMACDALLYSSDLPYLQFMARWVAEMMRYSHRNRLLEVDP